jgi:hypothetical protein
MEACEQPVDEHFPSHRFPCSTVTAPVNRRRQGGRKTIDFDLSPAYRLALLQRGRKAALLVFGPWAQTEQHAAVRESRIFGQLQRSRPRILHA